MSSEDLTNGEELPEPREELPEPREELPEPCEEQTPPEEWGEDISEGKDKGIFKKILIPGSGPEKPIPGNEVIVHYTGRLLNGEVFDSSVERDEKFTFKLGEQQVIKGWDVGVATMLRGEKCILTCTPEYAYGKNGSPPKIGPDETLQFEVELFDWKGEDLTSDGGVVKYVLSKGGTYSTPVDGSSVEVHLRGTYQGRTFQEADIAFDFGEGSESGIVSGVETAIGSMKVDESARVHVKPEYAYGEEGCAELSIPGGAELVYEIRLNKFAKVKDPWEYDSLEERLDAATQLKERGGKYFKEGKYVIAKKLYNRGAELITDTSLRKEDVKEQAKPMRVALHLNVAACNIKLQEPAEALKECDEVLTDDSENIKAFFRRGQGHQMLQDYEEALEAFQKVVVLEPSNKAAQRQLIQTRNMIRQLKEKEKKRYANMFDKLAANSEKEQEEAEKPEEPSKAAEEAPKEEDTEAAPVLATEAPIDTESMET